MAILEGGNIVPPRTQAISRSPAPLGLTHHPMIAENEKALQIRAQLLPLLCHFISIHQEHDMISSQQYYFLLSIFGANLINNV